MKKSTALVLTLLCGNFHSALAEKQSSVKPVKECPADTPKLNLFPKHDGIWEGSFKLINLEGKVEAEWKSRILMKLDCSTWHQMNTYTYPDGKTVTYKFPAVFSPDGVLRFDTERIKSTAFEAGNHIIMDLKYVDGDPWADEAHQIITLIGEDERFRVLKRVKNGRPAGITLIQEKRVSRDVDMSLFK